MNCSSETRSLSQLKSYKVNTDRDGNELTNHQPLCFSGWMCQLRNQVWFVPSWWSNFLAVCLSRCSTFSFYHRAVRNASLDFLHLQIRLRSKGTNGMELFTIFYFACRVLVWAVGRLKHFKLFPKLLDYFCKC